MPFDAEARSNPVILYDGACGMCSRVVTRVIRRERTPTFVFAALGSEYARRELRRRGYDEAPPNTVVVLDGSKIRIRSDAALFIAARLKFPERLAVVLRVVPPRLRDAAYDFVATRRQRWFQNDREACAVPDAATRRRFRDRA